MALRQRNTARVEFSMASMSDLVFLLLIFFILISTMVSPYALNVNLPSSNNKSTEKASVSVTITMDQQHYINGNPVAVEQIESLLKQEFAGSEKPHILLHVDKEVPTGVSVNILDIANRNKYGIVLATKAMQK